MKGVRLALLALLLTAAGCSEKAIQARGFVLPEGDPYFGQKAFVALQCQQCHTVNGVELDADSSMRDGPVLVNLGGDVTRIKTYGELVTAIIHPSERVAGDKAENTRPDGRSWMTVYNERMTVQELIDIVAFLQPQYNLVTPPYIMP